MNKLRYLLKIAKDFFKKTIFINSVFLYILFCLSSPALVEQALAQTVPPTGVTDLRLTTSPLPINLKTTPGNTVTATLKVKNDGIKEENIKVTLMKFKADPETGVPRLSDREPGDEYFDWVTFSENNFQLPPNEWKTITATFKVPTTASFGYYYAVVFSRAQENITKAERQTILTGGTATLVLLEAQVPNAKKEIQISSFSADKGIYEFLPAIFSVKLHNSGNVHVVPHGNIFISRGGKQVAILEINPGKGSILPDSPRNFTEKWIDGFPVWIPKIQDGQTILDEQGNPELELKWDFKDAAKLRFGKYAAKLLLAYDDGQRDVPLEAIVSFWVVPWRVMIIAAINILIIIGFFYLLWYVIKEKRKNKK